MTLRIVLDVKFRFAFIDIGKVHQEWQFPVPVEAAGFAQSLVNRLRYDSRGVKVVTTLEQMGGGL